MPALHCKLTLARNAETSFLTVVALPSHLALSRNGVEPPKRALWAIKRDGEMKKQGVSRRATSKRYDYVSEGAGGLRVKRARRVWRMREHITIRSA